MAKMYKSFLRDSAHHRKLFHIGESLPRYVVPLPEVDEMLEEEPDDEEGRGGDQVCQQHVDKICLADYY